MRIRIWGLAIAFVSLAFSGIAQADLYEYYIGRDVRPTMVGGAYNGLQNPNLNRLTFLYAHTYPAPGPGVVNDWTVNHYHSKGTYSYTGPNTGATTAVNDFNGTFGVSNILPESPAINDILLMPGSGVFSGKLVTGINTSTDFNNLRIRSVDSLAGFPAGSSENYLHVSSDSRWAGSMANTNIWMQLVSIDPGLSIHDTSGNLVFPSVGSTLNLGNGSLIDFTPVFAVDHTDSVLPGQNFNATFRLFDTGSAHGGGGFLDGGRFVFQVTAVPEPTSLGLLGTTLLGLVGWRRRVGA